MSMWEASQGLGLQEADLTLLGYTCSWLLSYGMRETYTWRPGSEKKNMARLRLCTRAPASPSTFTPCSLLDPCKPLTCSNRAQWSLWSSTHGVSHFNQSHKPAPSKPWGPAAVCSVDRKSGHFLSLDFSLLLCRQALHRSPGPQTAAWLMCVCVCV